MDGTITLRSVGRLCRICLTTSKNLVYMTNPITEKVLNFEEGSSIHSMLEMVTNTKVILGKSLPSKICHMCLSYLKIAYEIQMQYKNSQELLKDAFKIQLEELDESEKDNSDMIQEEEEQSSSVAVELIFAGNKFDLNDVVVVEEESKEKFSYQGFLKNLGTEVTARFVGDKNDDRISSEDQDQYDVSLEPQDKRINDDPEQDQHDVSLEPQDNRISNVPEQPTFNNLDLSNLKVTKNPQSSKVLIEEVTDTSATQIKTLYECKTCKKIFSEKSHLDAHREARHPKEKILICEKCGHQAHTQSQLYHHLQMHKERAYQCNFCERNYNTLSRLKVHLEIHKNERRHLCNLCGKRFNYDTSLKYHLEWHSGRNLACNICGAKYTRPNTLKRHLQTHTKEKPFSCKFCPKKFCSKGEQASHEMIHTGARPYRCKYCNKGFTKPYNMHVHCLGHPGLHPCELCSKTFIDVKYLHLHIKRAHKDYEIVEVFEN